MDEFDPEEPTPLINNEGRTKRSFLGHLVKGTQDLSEKGNKPSTNKKQKKDPHGRIAGSKEEEEEEEEEYHGKVDSRKGKTRGGTSARDPVVVTGHPWGTNRGITDGGCLFRLSKNPPKIRPYESDGPDPGSPYERLSENLEYLTVEKFGSLPSYCPWIEYDLLVVLPRGRGSTYKVTRVLDCRKRKIQKKELVDYLCHVRGSDDEDAAARDKKRFSKRLRTVPKVIDDFEEDVRQNMENEDLDARDLDDDLDHRIEKILEPATKGPIFTCLLRYFGSGLLLRFDDLQLTFFLFLAKKSPQVFVFWDSLLNLTKKAKIRKKRIFGPAQVRALEMHPKYALPVKFGGRKEEILTCSDSQPINYSVKFPVWSVKKLRYAVQDLGTDVGEDVQSWIRNMKDTADLYLRMESNFYSFGNTRFRPDRLFPQPFIVKKENLEMIYRYDLLTDAEVETAVGTTTTTTTTTIAGDDNDSTESNGIINVRLMKRSVDRTETKLARLIKFNSSGIRIFSCPRYDDWYFEKLLDFILKSQDSSRSSTNPESDWANETLLCSASSSTASYVNQKTGLSVLSVEDWTHRLRALFDSPGSDPNFLSEQFSRVKKILIDRAHKISPLHLSDLMSVVIKGTKNPETCVELILVGDLEEYPPKSTRGGGNLLVDIARSAPYAVTYWREWDG